MKSLKRFLLVHISNDSLETNLGNHTQQWRTILVYHFPFLSLAPSFHLMFVNHMLDQNPVSNLGDPSQNLVTLW